MKIFFVLLVGLLMVFGCINTPPLPPSGPENDTSADDVPITVSNKFTELDAIYNQSLGTRLSICTKANETIYMVDGSGGFSGETYYYDWQGNQLGTYYWDDVMVPNEPRSPINISAYSCILLMESNNPSTTPQNFSTSFNHSTKNYIEKTIASGSYAKAVAGYGNCNEPYALILLNATEPIGESIQWFSQNHPNESLLSWWDYGNAFDCAGLKSIISTKNLDNPNILEVAHLLVQSNETELGNFMSANGIQYILLSDELVKSPDGSFGGKYWALNYLACARNQKINLSKAPTTSGCEIKNSPVLPESGLTNGPFYQSILYKVIILGNLDGFQKVYDKDGVKIFKFLPAN